MPPLNAQLWLLSKTNSFKPILSLGGPILLCDHHSGSKSGNAWLCFYAREQMQEIISFDLKSEVGDKADLCVLISCDSSSHQTGF